MNVLRANLTEAQRRAYRIRGQRGLPEKPVEQGGSIGRAAGAAPADDIRPLARRLLRTVTRQLLAFDPNSAVKKGRWRRGSVPPVDHPRAANAILASRQGDLWIPATTGLLCGNSTSGGRMSPSDERRAGDPCSRPTRRIWWITTSSNHPTRTKDWSQVPTAPPGTNPLRRAQELLTTAFNRRRRGGGDHRGCRLVLLARLAPAGRCWRPAGRRPGPRAPAV